MTISHALERIARGGAVRSPELAAELGLTPGGVEAMLDFACRDGRLVSCDVTVGDTTVKEYRLSASGDSGLTGRARSSAALSRHFVPAASILIHRGNTEANAADPHPRAAEAPTRGNSTVKFDKEQVKELFRAHGPMTSRELTKRHGVDDAARMCALVAGNGEFAILGGGTRSKVYGLPDQSMADRKVQDGVPAGGADKPPRSIHRRRGKRQVHRAGGGSAAMRHKRVKKGSSKAAKRAWKTRRANAKKNGAAAAKVIFRPALCADGAILFMGAKGGDFEMPREQVRGLVKLVRGLTGPELAVAVGFVERLDRAEVSA